jgi:methionyl-tRNA synthetase
MELAQTGNIYFDSKKPWISARSALTHQDMFNTISCCLECLKTLAIISFPIIPETAEKVWKMLGFNTRLSTVKWDESVATMLPSGQALPQPQILFTKIEDDMIQKEIEKLKQMSDKVKAPAVPPPFKEQISIDDVRKLDLRVAKILHVERVPKSKKLLKLTVDVGAEQRTIVAGIGEKLEDISTLVGKKITIVANLKPAVLMGVESQGMVLAADTIDGLELPSFEQAGPGTSVS